MDLVWYQVLVYTVLNDPSEEQLIPHLRPQINSRLYTALSDHFVNIAVYLLAKR